MLCRVFVLTAVLGFSIAPVRGKTRDLSSPNPRLR